MYWLPRNRAVNFNRLNEANRFLLVNVTFTEKVQLLLSETRRVEIVVLPRFTCTDTRPVQP